MTGRLAEALRESLSTLFRLVAILWDGSSHEDVNPSLLIETPIEAPERQFTFNSVSEVPNGSGSLETIHSAS